MESTETVTEPATTAESADPQKAATSAVNTPATSRVTTAGKRRTVVRTRSTLPRPLLSVDEASILLGQSRASLYRAIERGDLPVPVFTINGRLRIARRAIERLLDGEPPIIGNGVDGSKTETEDSVE
jgi:predicted DNA-binding transcriptional regulator AlpA